MCMQDYESLFAAVMISGTLVNVQTDRQHLISLYDKVSQLS